MRSKKYEVMHVESWKTNQPRNLDELIEKYRPKQIAQYKENGIIIKVMEPR